MSNQESGVRRYAAVSALALAIGLLTFTPEATERRHRSRGVRGHPPGFGAHWADLMRRVAGVAGGSVGIGPT